MATTGRMWPKNLQTVSDRFRSRNVMFARSQKNMMCAITEKKQRRDDL
jgi:hypothetical protein